MESKEKLHKVVEAIISGDSKTATEDLHEYLQSKMRSFLLGEKKDDEKKDDDKKDDDKKDDDKKDDDKKDDDTPEKGKKGVNPFVKKDDDKDDKKDDKDDD